MPEHVTLNLTQIGAIVAGAGLIWGLIRKVGPALRRLGHLLDALVGVPEDGRPSIVSKVDTLTESVELIRKQVYPNGGASLPDRVGQLATGQAELTSQVDALSSRFGNVELRLAAIHQDTKPDPDPTGGTP